MLGVCDCQYRCQGFDNALLDFLFLAFDKLYSTTGRILRLCEPQSNWASEIELMKLNDTETDWAKQVLTYSTISVLACLRNSQFSSMSLQLYQIMTVQAHNILVVVLYIVQSVKMKRLPLDWHWGDWIGPVWGAAVYAFKGYSTIKTKRKFFDEK